MTAAIDDDTVVGQRGHSAACNIRVVTAVRVGGGISANGAACGGVRDSQFVGGGLPPSPVIATVPVDGQVDTVVIGAAQLSGGASNGLSGQNVNQVIPPTRKTIFWKSSGEN